MTKRNRRAGQGQLKLKDIIREQYPELILENKQRLCYHCKFYQPHGNKDTVCNYALLPVTSQGLPCPYWIEPT